MLPPRVSWRFLAIVCLAIAPGLACRSAPAASHSGPAAPRIVSLHDVTTEIVLALGAGDRLVGMSEPVELPSTARAAMNRTPRVGGLESIVVLQPTAVLGMAVVAQRSPDLVATLRRKGVDVWLGHPTRLEDVVDLVTEVGARVGAEARARTLAAQLRADIQSTKPPPGQPLRVFVYDCCDPPFTAGRTAVLTDVIHRAGGRNIFADVAADWTKVSWEEVISRRPQLVVVHDYPYEGQGDVAEKRRRLAALRALADIPVTVMPLGLALGGLRSFDGLAHLRKVLAENRGRG